jgi:hypothetical protein
MDQINLCMNVYIGFAESHTPGLLAKVGSLPTLATHEN